MNTKKKGFNHAQQFATGGAYKSHELKSWPEFFQKVLSKEKTFEFRLNDRDFQIGDYVTLLEFIPEGRELEKGGVIRTSCGEFTGEWIRFRVTDILRSNKLDPEGGDDRGVWHIDPRYVILSFHIEDSGKLSGAKALQERLL